MATRNYEGSLGTIGGTMRATKALLRRSGCTCLYLSGTADLWGWELHKAIYYPTSPKKEPLWAEIFSYMSCQKVSVFGVPFAVLVLLLRVQCRRLP